MPKTLEKKTRCQKGFIRDKKTGECVSNTEKKTLIKDSSKTKKNVDKLSKILEKRRKCIRTLRNRSK